MRPTDLRNNPELYLVLVAVLMALLRICFKEPIRTFDYASYQFAWENLKNGTVDPWRTPLYPVFVGLCREIGGNRFVESLIVILQYAAFIATAPLLYRLILRFCKLQKTSFWLSVLFVICPPVVGYANALLTESFALSLTIVWLYLTLRIWDCGPSAERIILYAINLLALVMFRPSFAYCFVVAGIFAIMLFWKDIKGSLWLLGSVFAAGLIVLGYAFAIRNATGVMTLSAVGLHNQCWLCDDAGIHPVKDKNGQEIAVPENGFSSLSGEEFGEIANRYQSHNEFLDAQRKFTNVDFVEVSEYQAERFLQNKRAYAEAAFMRFIHSGDNCFLPFPMDSFDTSNILSILCWPIKLPNKINYILYVAMACLCLIYWSKGERFPAMTLLLVIMACLCVALVVICAPVDFKRLLVPNLPINFILYGVFLSRFKVRKNASLI